MLFHAYPPWRDRTAIAISIALHCCALTLLVLIPRPDFTPDVVDERVLLTSIIRIEHRAPPRVAMVHPASAVSAPVRPFERPVIHAAHTESHAARALVVATERRFSEQATEAAVKPARAVAAPAVIAADPHPLTIAVTATPTAMPTPTPPAAVTVAVAHDEGIGNFGEDYPAKVDPQARASLFAGIPDTVQIRVTVDENGHAIAVEFVRGPADPALLQELRSRLMAARFIPAVCNGLRCAGMVPLHN
jgi:hypothetical protein